MGTLSRLVLAAGALIVAVWLAGNLRAVERQEDALVATGQAVGSGRAADLDRASQTFAEARRLAPDAAVKVSEAGVLVGARPKVAARLLNEVVREEPENAEAWALIYSLSKSRDDPVARRARRRVIALDPEAVSLLERFEATR